MAGASLRHEGSIRAGRDFEVEDVGSVALVEDEEYLREGAVACDGFKVDNLINKSPVPAPQTSVFYGANPYLYDVLGRMYRVGVRMSF